MTATKRRAKSRRISQDSCEHFAAKSLWSVYHEIGHAILAEPQKENDSSLQSAAVAAVAARRHPAGHASTASAPQVKSFLDQVRGRARLASVVGRIPALRAIASELFLGNIDFEIEDDPEINGRQTLVVSVEVKAGLQEVARLRREWYNHVGGLLGDECELVQLLVTVND